MLGCYARERREAIYSEVEIGLLWPSLMFRMLETFRIQELQYLRTTHYALRTTHYALRTTHYALPVTLRLNWSWSGIEAFDTRPGADKQRSE
ncbi:hypothetical protein AT302_01805 [Pandoraea norimbergensis]|uniref:Uncharacterized protein n=1 Tax=Pandoraea norimbergensis TaxID=93219 RepID=A0ABM5WER6_9BURK|nr:hypothetical protein AT302_01805 [Pandoraea norimbergensis]